MKKLFCNASEIITNTGVALKKGIGIQDEDLGILYNSSLAWSQQNGIEWMGPTKKIPRRYLKGYKKCDLASQIISPALVDCHTHLVFGGSRHAELGMRLSGLSYQDIAARGGGIKSSVEATRSASERSLFIEACRRVETSMSFGVGILEIKSGYGLDWPNERKILRVIQKLKSKFKNNIMIRSTFLGAHAFPAHIKNDLDREKYVLQIVNQMLPAVAKKVRGQSLADACDVFFDEGYFNSTQSAHILKKAKSLGLQIKLHADELADVGGARLAAELGALSADHLLRANRAGLIRMAAAEVVAVLLPSTAFYLDLPYASLQKMKNAGLCLALATDFNPGSSTTQNLPFVMALACLKMGMTMPQAFAAATYGGARALGLHQSQGLLKIGGHAKMAVFNCPSYQSLISQIASPGLCTGLL